MRATGTMYDREGVDYQHRARLADRNERLVETHRAIHVRAQAEAWNKARPLRRYCDAIDAASTQATAAY